MRVSALLIISLIGNLILGVALILNLRQSPNVRAVVKPSASQNVLTQQVIKARAVVKTNVLKEQFSWQQIEAADYPTYIANLRAVGCPEPTIRHIIIADVNHLYARKRITEKPAVNDQWWKSDPDSASADAEQKRFEALERERRALLTQLLGPNWDEEENFEKSSTAVSGLVLSGPILSKLSPQTVEALNASYQKMKDAYQRHLSSRRMAGLSEDPVEVARIRKEFRSEIERILTPEQLEEFLLRYSHISSQLRQRSQALNLTPQEFRSMFRVLDRIESQMSASDFADNEAATQRRANLEASADESIKQILGEQRFQQYKYGQDAAYKEAKTMAKNLGVSDEMAKSIYEINKAVKNELQRINSDALLTEEEKTAQIEAAKQGQIDALHQILGDEAFKRWEQLYGQTK